MRFGVCIIAIGYELYGSYALNLAISLKAYDQNVKIALLCDPESISHLTGEEKLFFDEFVFIPHSDYTIDGKKEYMRVKLMVNKYTPFDRTIYLDADNIWLDKKISWLFGEMLYKDFYIGMNAFFDVKKRKTSKNGYTYWCRDENECCNYHKIKLFLPQTVSGFFYFEKSFKTDLIFEKALLVYDDKKAPCDPFAGCRPDEYCFNVALGSIDYTQPGYNPIYFDKLHGSIPGAEIYSNYFGIAIGGNRVSKETQTTYDKLVNKYATMVGLEKRHYYVAKSKVIPERKL